MPCPTRFMACRHQSPHREAKAHDKRRLPDITRLDVGEICTGLTIWRRNYPRMRDQLTVIHRRQFVQFLRAVCSRNRRHHQHERCGQHEPGFSGSHVCHCILSC